jgi:cytochrome P450
MDMTQAMDWDPRSPAVLDDQIGAYDAMRQRCPVARSDYLHWSLFRHGDVLRAALDHETLGNAVSSHPSVPNGMDPPEHGPYRELIEPYFGPAQLALFEPQCRRIAQELVQTLPSGGEVEWMAGFAQDCALRMLCAFMGWPPELHAPLRQWALKNQAVTLAGDREAMAAIAFEFDGYIRAQLELRGRGPAPSADDVTTRLLRETVNGRPLSDEEIVSIVRNWTVGELSTMAACFGILAHYLATHDDLQQRLREQPVALPAAIDEILRIHAPLIANRRSVRKDVEFAGRLIPAGERVTLLWASANRDESVFGNPDEFRLDREPSLNLLYGAGIHVCPGAPLARMQLRLTMEALLAQTRRIAPVPGKAPLRACYPASGFSRLPLWVERS